MGAPAAHSSSRAQAPVMAWSASVPRSSVRHAASSCSRTVAANCARTDAGRVADTEDVNRGSLIGGSGDDARRERVVVGRRL